MIVLFLNGDGVMYVIIVSNVAYFFTAFLLKICINCN